MKADWCNIPVSVPWCSTDHYRDVRIWLLDHINHADYAFAGVDSKNQLNRIVYFGRDKDATLFALRWL